LKPFNGPEAGYVQRRNRLLERGGTMVFLWVIVALLLLFAIVGGIAIAKFLFFVLIAAAVLALIGFFARTA
jgi:hypothetical protein